MVVNEALARERNISKEDQDLISEIHDHLEYYVTNAYKWPEARQILVDHFRAIEYLLQDLWGFDRDPDLHTWKYKLYERFREIEYVGNVYRCTETGETRKVTLNDVNSKVLFSVGNGFIDFGSYHVRFVGPIEIVV